MARPRQLSRQGGATPTVHRGTCHHDWRGDHRLIFRADGKRSMIPRPTQIGTFEFVVLASLRAAQLTRGCRSKVNGQHKVTVLAQIEVAEGRVVPVFGAVNALPSDPD